MQTTRPTAKGNFRDELASFVKTGGARAVTGSVRYMQLLQISYITTSVTSVKWKTLRDISSPNIEFRLTSLKPRSLTYLMPLKEKFADKVVEKKQKITSAIQSEDPKALARKIYC